MIENLSNLRKQFLRWVMHTYMRRRALDLWLDRMNYRSATEFFGTPGEDLYPDPLDPDFVTGQIEELVHLATGLGRTRVVFLCDMQEEPTHLGRNLLEEMFGGLEFWQNPSFTLKIALPETLLTQDRLHERACGRIVLRNLVWSDVQHAEILRRHLHFWGGAEESLDEMFAPGVLATLLGTLDDIFGGRTPRSAVSLARAVLELAASRPIEAADLPRLQRELYRRCAPLRLDGKLHGVWRGERFIALNDQPYLALDALWRARKGDSTKLLFDVAGSKQNVHTLVKRVRQAVEPLPDGEPLYICKESGDAYRLENTTNQTQS